MPRISLLISQPMCCWHWQKYERCCNVKTNFLHLRKSWKVLASAKYFCIILPTKSPPPSLSDILVLRHVEGPQGPQHGSFLHCHKLKRALKSSSSRYSMILLTSLQWKLLQFFYLRCGPTGENFKVRKKKKSTFFIIYFLNACYCSYCEWFICVSLFNIFLDLIIPLKWQTFSGDICKTSTIHHKMLPGKLAEITKIINWK